MFANCKVVAGKLSVSDQTVIKLQSVKFVIQFAAFEPFQPYISLFLAGISATTLSCADTGAAEGCTDGALGKTCICSGALCNEYKSAAVSISAPIVIVFTLALSGLAFVF